MAHKSKTLELADALEKNGDGCTCCAYASFECCCNAVWGSDYTREAAAEIRRLHEENVYLRDVYQSLVQDRSELFDDLDKAVAAEREACAKENAELLQALQNLHRRCHWADAPEEMDAAKAAIEKAIRARGEA